MTTTIYQKTEKGQDEIRTRANRLDQRHRAVLLMVNGEKTCDDILLQLQPLGMTQAVFDELEQGGYIRIHVGSPVAAKAAPAPTPVVAAPGDQGVEGYQRLYRFYTETISRYLGLRGYLLEMKVEKAGSISELIALRETLKAALAKTRGEPDTSNVIAQLDLLIEEATG
ncbi:MULTISPECIES: hypothetical protein [Ralstonia]|uniref:Proline-rich protein n=1 Tax=Ralstonia mannitolilytica TaxID=105219 RepID=A0AAJ5D4I2_9RALS|nr:MULTISPECIES: hypothetical protein [Ralstonia]AJW45329.1 proline-rich protein [Ralstonia mannitolilytica]MBU9579316.1 hypothetical protein [Ralstonia mannitolilytica]PLT19232.1 hypothetical protein CXP34_04465 [Ralstonia mannitolilytica]QIF07536.1 hypothetical protein G5A69_07495 [Ralstonia mannitolilytica]CAG2138635.1 hypothetical protein LMG6866_01761 [Ralstonia mannitolilytica]